MTKIYYPIFIEFLKHNEKPFYLLSYLKQHSNINFTSLSLTKDNINQIENNPDNYIIISTTSIKPFIKLDHFIQTLRQYFGKIKCKIVVGGALYYLLNTDDVFKYYPEITHICKGKGEEVLKSIIEKDLPPGVYNAEDFDRVKSYTLCEEYMPKQHIFVTFRDSRCGWSKCLFCHHQTRCVYPNKPAEEMANDIAYYCDNFGIRHFYFYDNEMRSRKLAKFFEILYKKGYAKKNLYFYIFGIRVDDEYTALKDILSKWPWATISGIAWGVEFFDQEILDRFQKGVTTDQILDALNFFPQFGTVNDVYLLFGLPTVTNKNIQNLENFIKNSFDNVGTYSTSYFLLNNALKIKSFEKEFKIKENDYFYTIQDFFNYTVDLPPIRTGYIDFCSWDDDLQKYATRDETFLKYFHLYKKYYKVKTSPELCYLKDATHSIIRKERTDMYL